jgi:pyruvate dehydrogenase (quinone)
MTAHRYPLSLSEGLNADDKIITVVVAGAPHVHREAMAVAEKLGPGVAKALLGKTVMPDLR